MIEYLKQLNKITIEKYISRKRKLVIWISKNKISTYLTLPPDRRTDIQKDRHSLARNNVCFVEWHIMRIEPGREGTLGSLLY